MSLVSRRAIAAVGRVFGRTVRRYSARSGFPASPVSSIITELPGVFKTESGEELQDLDVVWEQWGDPTLPSEKTVRSRVHA